MTILRIGGVCLLATACAKPHSPAGDPGPLQLTGTYEMVETLYSSDCSSSAARAFGIEERKNKIRVDVLNSPPSTLLRLTVNIEPFDGQVLSNGRFDVKPMTVQRGAMSLTKGISGRFTATGFSARYLVETREPLPQVRPGPTEYRVCKYNFLWEGLKL